jgi:hypothetical protein
MAPEAIGNPVVDQRDIAVLAAGDPSAGVALDEPCMTALIEEQDTLISLFDVVVEAFEKKGRAERPFERLLP